MARIAGTKNKRSIAMQHKAALGGELPLDVLLRGMRYHVKKFEEAKAALQTEEAEGFLNRAGAFAEKAAPYLHARLANVQVQADHTVNYVARLPDTAQSAEQWEDKHSNTIQ